MRIRRFRAREAKTALQMVKDELGPEAVILATREIREDGLGVVAVEITAGAGQEIEVARSAGAPTPTKPGPDNEEPAPALKDLEMGLAEIKDLLLDLTHRSSLSERFRDRKDLLGLYRNLLDAELDPTVARALTERTGVASNGQGTDLEAILKQKLSKLMLTAAPLNHKGQNAPRNIALIGQSGVGKTTTLAKLAAFWSAKGQRKIALISLDTFRLGAAEQLRTYARIMGLPVRVVQGRSEFREAIDLFEKHDLILIDTSGRSLNQPESFSELSETLMNVDRLAVLLVLAAPTKDRDLATTIRQTESLSVQSLIISKIDETQRYGNVINNLIKFKKPVSFLTNGQKVPDDLIPATPGHLAELITLGG